MKFLLKLVRGALCVLGFALGLAGLIGAGAGLGGGVSRWLDVATHLAPAWILASLVALACGVVAARGRVRAVLAGLALVGLALGASLVVPELTRPIRPMVPAEGLTRIRLIQFNSWDRNTDPEAAAAWIAAQKPDIVTIEELTPAIRESLVARGFAYSKGVETVAIFSRLPRAPAPYQVPMAAWKVLPEFARGTYLAPDGKTRFSVLAVHLTWPTLASHWGQRRLFADFAGHYPRRRLILAGDFNLTPWSFALRDLDRRFGLERRDRAIPSWPAMRHVRRHLLMLAPVLPIDHVYAGSDWRTISIRRGPKIGSDHYPLVVDLALVPELAPPDQ